MIVALPGLFSYLFLDFSLQIFLFALNFTPLLLTNPNWVGFAAPDCYVCFLPISCAALLSLLQIFCVIIVTSQTYRERNESETSNKL